MPSLPRVILCGFSQPVELTGLDKALKISGVQDFLRLLSKSHSTWDHLLGENLSHDEPG